MSDPEFVTAGCLALEAAEKSFAEHGNMALAIKAATRAAHSEVSKAGRPIDIQNRDVINALTMAGIERSVIVPDGERLKRLWVSEANQ